MTELNSDIFFTISAEFYDDMVDFEQKLPKRQALLKNILPTEKMKIADLGSGTGIDSISMALLGHNVTAFDPSEGMIQQLNRNCERFNVSVNPVRSKISDIDSAYNDFSFAVSLGNTFALIPPDELGVTFERLAELLAPGRTLIIQILNYHKIISEQKRIVAIVRNNGKCFIRFYDFFDSHLNFNILTFDEENISDHQIITTKIYPHSISSLKTIAAQRGFDLINIFGSLDKTEFDEEKSNDVVMMFRRIV